MFVPFQIRELIAMKRILLKHAQNWNE